MDGTLNQFAQAAAPAADADTDADAGANADAEDAAAHVANANWNWNANANEPDMSMSDTSGSYVLQPPDEEADAELPLPDADEGSCAYPCEYELAYFYSYCLLYSTRTELQIIALTSMISARRTLTAVLLARAGRAECGADRRAGTMRIDLDSLCHPSLAAVEDEAASGFMITAAAAGAIQPPAPAPVRPVRGGLLASPNRALEPLLESEYELQSDAGGGSSDVPSAASSKRVSRTSGELSPERLAQQQEELEAEFGRLLDWLDECESLLEFVSQSIDESNEPTDLQTSSTPPAPAASDTVSNSDTSAASASASVSEPPASEATSSKKKLDIDQQISLVKVCSFSLLVLAASAFDLAIAFNWTVLFAGTGTCQILSRIV